jgi:transcriptional regulator with XRE-family HTH domain
MTTLSERLKFLRKRKHITQEQLAEYMHISPQAVSRWETGATSPDISALPVLADLFNISVDELLGINEAEKQREVNKTIEEAEGLINKGVTEEPIICLREALNKYPNNDRLQTCLMYALFAASEDEELCREYDSEIVSLAYRISQYSTDDVCRNEARRLLFRHYCETNRTQQALLIADGMAKIDTCYERNVYWALDGEVRVKHLYERIEDDLRELVWDLWAYSIHANIGKEKAAEFDDVRDKIEKAVKGLFR